MKNKKTILNEKEIMKYIPGFETQDDAEKENRERIKILESVFKKNGKIGCIFFELKISCMYRGSPL